MYSHVTRIAASIPTLFFSHSGLSETDHVSDISRAFFQFANGGQPLEPNTVAQAIAADFSLKKVRTTTDVYIGQLCAHVRTLSVDRGSLINADNGIADESFLYEKLYCELPKLLRSYRKNAVTARRKLHREFSATQRNQVFFQRRM